MPREHKNLVRLSNVKSPAKLLFIASEGANTERQYFNELERACDKNIVHPFHLQRHDDDIGRSAPSHVLKEIACFKSKSPIKFKKGDEFWVVLDVDNWTNLPEIVQGCEKANVHLAISCPCFDLWMLLHVTDVEKLDTETKEKIRTNAKISNSHSFLSQYLSEAMTAKLGKSFTKKKSNSQSLMPHIETAIKRAKALTGNLTIPSSLGSNVYKLVEKIKIED